MNKLQNFPTFLSQRRLSRNTPCLHCSEFLFYQTNRILPRASLPFMSNYPRLFTSSIVFIRSIICSAKVSKVMYSFKQSVFSVQLPKVLCFSSRYSFVLGNCQFSHNLSQLIHDEMASFTYASYDADRKFWSYTSASFFLFNNQFE